MSLRRHLTYTNAMVAVNSVSAGIIGWQFENNLQKRARVQGTPLNPDWVKPLRY
jgi:hypothetical protein